MRRGFTLLEALVAIGMMVMLVGALWAGILSLWREPATVNDATASSWPNAGIASMFIRLPDTAMAEVLATNDSCASVSGVGLALG